MAPEDLGLTARDSVRPAGGLNQATPTGFGAITLHGVAQLGATFISGLLRRRAQDFAYAPQLAPVMPGLGNERRRALLTIPMRLIAESAQEKNAGITDGVRQGRQLLLCDRRGVFQAQKYPLSGRIAFGLAFAATRKNRGTITPAKPCGMLCTQRPCRSSRMLWTWPT